MQQNHFCTAFFMRSPAQMNLYLAETYDRMRTGGGAGDLEDYHLQNGYMIRFNFNKKSAPESMKLFWGIRC